LELAGTDRKDSTLHGFEDLEGIFGVREHRKAWVGAGDVPRELRNSQYSSMSAPPIRDIASIDTKLIKYCLDDVGEFHVREPSAESLTRALTFNPGTKLGVLAKWKKPKDKRKKEGKDKSKKNKKRKHEDVVDV